MKNYAYLDRGNILHVVTEEETARQFAKAGKVLETDLAADMGYPVEKGERLVVYGPDEAYAGGNAGEGARVSLNAYPRILALYQSL